MVTLKERLGTIEYRIECLYAASCELLIFFPGFFSRVTVVFFLLFSKMERFSLREVDAFLLHAYVVCFVTEVP